MRFEPQIHLNLTIYIYRMEEGRPLNHVELLTITEKDQCYTRDWLTNDIQEIAQQVLGIRTWIRFRESITTLSNLSYFSFTSLAGLTTLGEEWCEANPPKELWRQLLMVALNNHIQLPSDISKLVQLFKDINLITFYLFGDFYEIAKRTTDFSYRTHLPETYGPKTRHLYKLLGILTIIRLGLTTNAQYKTISEPQRDIVESKTSAGVCALCSGQRVDPTSAICGHIFCWSCIHQWLKERSECPVCRTPTEPSRLIYLINFL